MTTLSMIGKGRAKMFPGILGICVALVLIVAMSAPALALPQLPQRFQGRVTINATPAPAGVQVSARISGVSEVFAATTDAGGYYALLYVKGDDPDTARKEGGVDGDTIQFFVAGTAAASSRFASGNSTTLNLSITRAVSGTVYETRGVPLANAVIAVDDGTVQVLADTSGFYQVSVLSTGSHSVVASKVGFRSSMQTINITDTSLSYQLDFKADIGLIPNTPDVSYVLNCINKWKYPPDGLGLSLTKVLSVIHAWKFPF